MSWSTTKEEPISIDRACRVTQLSRSQWYYRTKRDGSEVIENLGLLADKYTRKGIGTYYKFIRREGKHWGRNRVLRVYRKMKLSIRRKGKRKLPARLRVPLAIAEGINSCWAIDFMSDALMNGRRVRVLNILDEYTREALTIYPDYSIPSASLINQLEILEKPRGLLNCSRLDNGPELTSLEFTEWCASKNITLKYIQPGKPRQNAFIERFNKTYRQEILDAYIFEDLEQLRILSEEMMWKYNHEIPHGSLMDLTPKELQ